jgi:predicted ester cyclase
MRGRGVPEDCPVDVIRTAVAELNAGHVDAYLQSFQRSCLRWISGFEEPLTLTDVSDGSRQLRNAFDPLSLDEDLLFGDGRFVCARWRLQGVHIGNYMGYAPTLRSIDMQSCEVYEFDQGLVSATWTYADPGQIFRQIT